MGKQKFNKITVGIVAHVDSGKTTLAEAILFSSGTLETMGRVDHQNAFLDTNEIEKNRGITVFSKIARMELGEVEWIFLDTPGHQDFSAEMERVLSVLDYAIFIINGAEGILGQSKTLWELLEYYSIPTFVFVNKMDQEVEKIKILEEVRREFGPAILEFDSLSDDFFEELAMNSDDLAKEYLEDENISIESIRKSICRREVFPCYFGSALKIEGIQEFIFGLQKWVLLKNYSDEFGARVYKINYDNNIRLTEMKITGGVLENRRSIGEEKINEIRLYSGNQYTTVQKVHPGEICSVVGLHSTYPGEGLGYEKKSVQPIIAPILHYRIYPKEEKEKSLLLDALKILEEEMPELKVDYLQDTGEIILRIMGEVFVEILEGMIKDRFGIEVSFDEGSVLYKEKVKTPSIGIGHFEPLRHYAEVQLLLEPGEVGRGNIISSKCETDKLNKSTQNQIMQILREEVLKGVLTGSELIDTKITLLAGRSHEKHTEGGDFLEATKRALRQGLMIGESELLEPYYKIEIHLPNIYYGRVLNDLTKLKAIHIISEQGGEDVCFYAELPVNLMKDYIREIRSYSKGEAKVQVEFSGYHLCHNEEEVLAKINYDPEKDRENPSSSVFCSQGSGFLVPWDKVYEYAHIPPMIKKEEENLENVQRRSSISIDEIEIEKILRETFYSNRKEEREIRRKKKKADYFLGREKSSTVLKEEILIVDGYNMIHSWEELKPIVKENLEASRLKLLELLSNYQGLTNKKIIVVFDAYKVKGREAAVDHDYLSVVYTKEGETADQYIEKYIREIKEDKRVYVATSDNTEQVIVRGAGGLVISADDFREEVIDIHEKALKEFRSQNREIGEKPFEDL